MSAKGMKKLPIAQPGVFLMPNPSASALVLARYIQMPTATVLQINKTIKKILVLYCLDIAVILRLESSGKTV